MNEHRFRFPFYINADFVLAANRETLLDSPWNYYLLANIGKLIVQWVAELANKGERNCLNLLPLQYFDDSTLDVEQLAQSFNSAYRTALESEAFILNYKGELAKQDEIIIDKTGLSEIVGTDLFFCQLLQTEKCLPSNKIDSKILEEDIFEEIELMKFDDVIDAITNNSDFNEWFIAATDEQKENLYKWIDDNNNITSRKDDLRTFVANLPLFQFGEEYKSSEEISSSDYIVTTEHIIPIKGILSKLGFLCSDNVFNTNHPLFNFIESQNEVGLFQQITLHLLEQDGANLKSVEKLQLFKAFRLFKDVGSATLSTVQFFCNSEGQMSCLNEMSPFNENVPMSYAEKS